MDTTVRVLTLLGLLQEQRFWKGAELADALGVTARCVRRDVQRLRDLGYPVDASGGVGGGYALGAGTDLPPLPLTEDEAIAVAIGLKSAASGAVQGLEEPALRALAKLEVVLPRALRARLTAVAAASEGLYRADIFVNAHVLMALAAACRDSVAVELDYQARDGRRSHRRLHPVRLVNTEVYWYLVAWDRNREDWRTFRLDRIEPGSVHSHARLPPRDPPEPDVAAYVERKITPANFQKEVRVRYQAKADVVRKRLDRIGHVEADGPNHCWFTCRGEDLDKMAPWLASFGFPLDSVESVDLQDAYTRLGRSMLRLGRGAANDSTNS